MRTLLVCMLVVLTAGTARAAPVTLSAQALLATPGVVTVDTRNATTVQFCETVSWLAYKAPWLNAKLSQQDRRVLLLDTSAASGEASMTVWIEGQGRPLQLLVRASGTVLPNHLYFVSCTSGGGEGVASRPASPPGPVGVNHVAGGAPSSGNAAPVSGAGRSPTTRDTADPAALASSWDGFVAGLSSDQWVLLQSLIAAPSSDTYTAFTRSLNTKQAGTWSVIAPAAHLAPPAATSAGGDHAAASPSVAALPSWIAWSARATRGDTGALITYTVTNTGTGHIVLDQTTLVVTDATAHSLPGVSLSREDTSGAAGRIGPGGTESGVIRLPQAAVGDVTVRWSVVEGNGNVTYLLTDVIHLP